MTQDNEKTDLESLKETQEFWSKRSGREISLEDAREIQENLFEFVSILIEWDEKDKKALEKSNQENKPHAEEVCIPNAPGITDEEASQVVQDVLNHKITTDGRNITLSVEWPEDDVEDSTTSTETDVDSLIEYFRDRLWKTLSRDKAQEILNLHQD